MPENTIMNKNVLSIIGLSLVLAVLLPTAATADEKRIDLKSYVQMVENQSLQLTNAATDRAIARAQEKLVRSQLYPTIAGQLGYTRNLLDITQPMPVYAYSDGSGVYPFEYQDVDVNSDNSLTAGLSVQQKVFDMNVFRGLEASRQYTVLTATGYEAARQATLTAAKRLFYQTLLLQEVLEVRKSSEEIAYENYLETQKRLENGLASPLEALQAEVSWKISQPNTSQAEKNLNIALQNLKNLANIPEEQAVVLQGSLEKYPQLPDFAPAEAIRAQRPDYQALVSQTELRKLNISVEKAKFYPTVSASFSYGLQADDDGFDFSDPTDSLSAGISVTVPVFYGGSRFSSLEKARLELQKARTSLAQKESDISTEIETIRLTLQEAKLRIDSAKQTLETAEKAYKVSQSSVESGLATQLELKDARVSLEQARLNFLSAGYDYLSAYFDWQLAVGQGAEIIEVDR
jgi:outer membrane protein TolC